MGLSVLQLDWQKVCISPALAKHTVKHYRNVEANDTDTGLIVHTSTNPHNHQRSYPLSPANLSTQKTDPCGKKFRGQLPILCTGTVIIVQEGLLHPLLATVLGRH